MWPFRKKLQPLNSDREPGQREQLMTEWAKKERFPFETICPLCLEHYPQNHIVIKYPFCPECSSEAIDYAVEPFNKFVESKSVSDFNAMLVKWDAQEGFRPEYKEQKRARILALKELKSAPL